MRAADQSGIQQRIGKHWRPPGDSLSLRTPLLLGWARKTTKKKAAYKARPEGAELLRRLRTLRLRSRGSSRCRLGCRSRSGWLRPRNIWPCARCRSRRRRYARLSIVGVHNRLGDIYRRPCPKHRPIRPGIGGIDNHAKTVVVRVLHHDGRHLLQNFLRNFVLLILGVLASVLNLPIQRFLLAFNLLYQRAATLVIELFTLGVELLFQTLQLIILCLELRLLGLKLFAQSLELFLAFIAGKDRLLNVDGSNLRAGCVGDRGGGRTG